ncbi:MAG: lysozyme family protein [Erysipelotrichaceae bacterium]
MKDIKVKQTIKNIKTSDKKSTLEHFEKKANVTTKDKQSNKNEVIEQGSSSPNQHAVNKVIKREKVTAVESVYRAKKYVKNKRSRRKMEDAHRIKTKEVVKGNAETTSSTLPKQDKPNIKQKQCIKKERTFSRKLKSLNNYSNIKKNQYNPRMKYLGVKKQQKKIKNASQKTTSIFRKGVSATGKTVKVAFKIVTKTVTSIHNLISFGGALILLVVITLFIGIFASLSSDSGVETSTLPLSADVLEHTEAIRKYAIENDIEDYVSLLQAIMMQESGGKGNDPMQSSEYEYNTKYPRKSNGIQEANYSIQVGVKYFADCIKEAKSKDSIDMQKIYLALQGYDFQMPYINWAIVNFNGYTRANAKVYSDEMRAKLQVDVYGDPNYVNHILQYYHLGNGDIVKVALTQVGNIDGKPYWEWYGFTSRVEWCACFVSWCANESGLLDKGIIPKFSYCPTGIQWFKEHNRWMKNEQTPQAGYIIFFDWEQDGISDHVGIVERVDNGFIYTIEGNSNNECKQNMYDISSNVIYGYGIIN